MTEAQWLASTDPREMLGSLLGGASDRKLRLWAVACCRRVWHLLKDERSRAGVEVRERYEVGRATVAELFGARDDARHAREEARSPFPFAAGGVDDQAPEVAHVWAAGAASAAASGNPDVARLAAWASACAAGADWHVAYAAERAVQAALLRCLFGNPFRPARVDPAWLAWNSSTVPRLAQAIYEDRTFGRLPVLADALEDAGCTDAEILAHCRGPGPHVRGCWAVDLLLGKE